MCQVPLGGGGRPARVSQVERGCDFGGVAAYGVSCPELLHGLSSCRHGCVPSQQPSGLHASWWFCAPASPGSTPALASNSRNDRPALTGAQGALGAPGLGKVSLGSPSSSVAFPQIPGPSGCAQACPVFEPHFLSLRPAMNIHAVESKAGAPATHSRAPSTSPL